MKSGFFVQALFKGFEMVDEQGQLLVTELVKAHVKGFTRKNGSVVKEHDDSRKKAVDHGTMHFTYKDRMGNTKHIAVKGASCLCGRERVPV